MTRSLDFNLFKSSWKNLCETHLHQTKFDPKIICNILEYNYNNIRFKLSKICFENVLPTFKGHPNMLTLTNSTATHA